MFGIALDPCAGSEVLQSTAASPLDPTSDSPLALSGPSRLHQRAQCWHGACNAKRSQELSHFLHCVEAQSTGNPCASLSVLPQTCSALVLIDVR